jgi:NAD(P)-dependent dehydrogenase (short-subunit alcohol dehydrogenase family)
MDNSSKDRVALVTGGGSGLGEATAGVLAEAGASVAVVDVSGERAARVAAALRERGGNAIHLAADVSDQHQVAGAVESTLGAFGRIDYVINGAGTDFVLPILDMTVEQWDRVLGVNLRAAFLFTKAVLPVMKQQGGGHIVNVASTAAKRAWANASAYHASKWGLVGFTRALGVEGRPYGVKATALVPGGMRTHFFDNLDPPPDLANLQDPKNVARVILFVLSQPAECAVQEVIVTPLTETSWP